MKNLNESALEPGGISDYNRTVYSALSRITEGRSEFDNVYYGDIGGRALVPFFLGCRRIWENEKVFLTMHDGPWFNPYPFSGLGLPRITQSLANRFVGRALNRSLLRRSSGVIVLLKRTRDLLLANGVPASRILYVPHFLYEGSHEIVETKAAVFYVIGYVRADKRIETTLSVAERVRRTGIDVEVRFVGGIRDAKLFSKYIKILERSGIHCDHVSPERVEDFGRYLSTPGFAIFDYDRDSISGSGSLMHALAGGVYCFLRHGSVLGEYLDETSGEYFETTATLPTRIVEIMENGGISVQATADRRALQRNRFSLTTISKKIVHFMETLISQR